MSRHRYAAAWVLAAATAVVALTVAFSPPPFVSTWFARDLPSNAAGDPVPPIQRQPATRIAVAGDTGTGDAAQQGTVDRMVAESRSASYDGLILLGDLIYEDGDADLVKRRVIRPFAPITNDGAELVPALGNHDYRSDEQGRILTALGRQRSWYVERVGSVRVVVLDSNLVDEPEQTAWLRDTLAKSQIPGTWTVVAMHHPPFSAGYHGSDLAVRKAWSRIFSEADVPLVLAGHDHDYQRSTPQDGVTYVVSGAGAKLRRAGHDDFTAVSASTLHYLDLLVYPNRLIGRAIDHSGRLVDSFTISR